MIDFLKQFPFVTRDEYLWEWTVPQIKIAKNDFTHINHLSEAEAKERKAKKKGIKKSDLAISDLGGNIF